MKDSTALGKVVVERQGLGYLAHPWEGDYALPSTRKWGQKLKKPGGGDRKESCALEGARFPS